MTNLIIAVLVTALVIIAYMHGSWKSKYEIEKRFANRQDIAIDDFYNRFYRSTGISQDVILELLSHVAAELTLPSSKLLPSDRFDRELAPARGWDWSSGHNILAVELKGWAREKKTEIDISTIETLDDYLRMAARVY